jgi:exodeoxyribonuclease VII large subunit
MAQKTPSLFDSFPDQPVFSVSEYLDFTNELLAARDAQVQGEVVGAKSHPTGFYFSIKDPAAGALMDCYMSPYAYRGSGIALEDGMLVRVGGIASIYKPKGRFSFRVETIALAGEGSLKKAYEALKKKLQEEGLFDRKRPLPAFVSRVGLITSRTGAVIDDFRRNLLPLGMQVFHYDVRVEGASAVGHLRRALDWFGMHPDHIDVLVMIRGGGSLEDLQAFNDEWVVRGVFGTRIPTVVSIGHDRDVPLAQMAADASGSTPTAAAHLINATWAPLTERLPRLAQKLIYEYGAALSSSHADVNALTHRLAVHLSRLAGAGTLLQHRLSNNLDRIGVRIRQLKESVAAAERHLDASNPERLLRLGYSIVTDETGAVIRGAGQLRHGQAIRTRLAQGAFLAEVKELESTS